MLPVLQISISQAGHALALLTGHPPAAPTAQLVAAEPPPQTGGALVMGIPAWTLRQRADVRAAEYQVAAALARADQAEAKRWPAFSIGGSLSLSALTLSALTNGASVLGTLLASVNWPVLDGGAALAQVLHRHLGRPLGRHGSAPHNHSMTPCPTSVPAAPQAPSAPVPAPAAKPRASGPAGEQVDLKALLGDTAARPWCRRGWLWAGVALPPAAADI